MTGFGKVAAEIAGKKVSVEVKALNSKQMDLAMKIAPRYRDQEMAYRTQVAAALTRGKTEFSLTVDEGASGDLPRLNEAAIAAYWSQIRSIASSLDVLLPYEHTLPMLLRLPEAVHTAEPSEADAAELGQVAALVEEALRRVVDFRRQEGEMLRRVFTEKLDNIAALLAAVQPYEQERTATIRRRIVEQLESLAVPYDRNRLEQELIYYIEKLDINEEKHRLDNHIRYFRETMEAPDAGQGKKLGFIAQEMGREINTLGSKANQAEMQRIVVRMKDELEQIKEQVLNVL